MSIGDNFTGFEHEVQRDEMAHPNKGLDCAGFCA